jgi:tetratricopeptide (TPR) repeat protein
VLVEFVFFLEAGPGKIPRRKLLITTALAGLIAAAAIALFFQERLFSLFNYDSRYFTLGERLLTQPRILLFYLSQIFYPAPFRLSIEHDITLSSSLFEPWSTLPSIVIIAAALCAAVVKAREWPFVSFGVLFFFLNHFVESSFIPLELIFEHRNYLPSMFLFVPVAHGFCLFLQHYRKQAGFMHVMVGGFAILLVFSFAFATFVRNQAWESPASLWEDAARKAPGSGRALAYVAMFQPDDPEGERRALELYGEALKRTRTNRILESEIYNNMAALYYGRRDFQKAEELWERAVQSRPGFLKARYCLALALTRSCRFEDALVQLDRVLSEDESAVPARNLRGCIYFMRHDLEKALADFRGVMTSDSLKLAGIVNAGAVHVASGHYSKADECLQIVSADAPELLPALLWRLKAALAKEDGAGIKAGLERMAAFQPSAALLADLASMNRVRLENDRLLLPAFDDHEIAALRQSMPPHHGQLTRALEGDISFR